MILVLEGCSVDDRHFILVDTANPVLDVLGDDHLHAESSKAVPPCHIQFLSHSLPRHFSLLHRALEHMNFPGGFEVTTQVEDEGGLQLSLHWLGLVEVGHQVAVLLVQDGMQMEGLVAVKVTLLQFGFDEDCCQEGILGLLSG